MNDKKITIMNKEIIFLLFFQLSLLCPFTIMSQQISQGERVNSSFLQSVIRFDDSSLEMLILHPEEVLSNSGAFWANDSAYKLVKQWHQDVSFPIPMERWHKEIQNFANIPLNKRVSNSQLVAAQKTIKKEKEFNEKAIPYLGSFLPKNCHPIMTTIFFTTAIMASGFQINNSIVIYGANADKDNLFIHELFHQGFNQYREKKLDIGYRDSLMSQIYYDLQNEGMATYVGYKALKEFPHIRTDMLKDDYKMFEKMEDIKELLNDMNNLLKKSFSLPEKELNDSLWQVGTSERAFYVVGCFMSKTIDEKLGRDALIETILHKPIYFVKTYNSLIDENMHVVDLSTIK